MLEMFIPCFTIDDDIIKEDQNEVPQVEPKYFIHQCLEYGRSISEAKGHDQKLIVAIMCAPCVWKSILEISSS